MFRPFVGLSLLVVLCITSVLPAYAQPQPRPTLATTCASLPSAASRPTSSRFGAVVIGTGTGATSKRETLLTRAAELNVGWIRLTAYWDALQPVGAGFDAAALADLKDQVCQARKRGLNVFMTLERSPNWARLCGYPGVSFCGDWRYPPHDNNYIAWWEYVNGLVNEFKTYPYDVKYWGIWNEPNSETEEYFKVQDGRDPVEEYKKLVGYAASYIRNAGGYVVAPDLAQSANMYDWLSRLLRDIGSYIDVVAVHQYNITSCTERDMYLIRKTAAQYGKPVWLTEAGWTGTDATTQTHNVAGVLNEMLDSTFNNGCSWHPRAAEATGDAYWDKTFIYKLHESEPDKATHLLEDYTYQPRPAYYCLQWYAGGQVGTRPASCVRDSRY